MLEPIMKAASDLSVHAASLLKKVTTNASENYMSHHAIVTGGKRTFKGSTDCYYSSCHLAGIQCSTGRVLSIMGRYINKDLYVAADLEEEVLKGVKFHRERKQAMKGHKQKNLFKVYDDGKDYGENHKEPDVSEDVYLVAVENHFRQLRENKNAREQIERETVQQSSSDDWFEYRRI